MQLQSTLTCPKCSYQAVEVMPTDACQFSSKSNSQARGVAYEWTK